MGDLLKLGILGTASIADRIVAGARKSSIVRVSAVAGRDPARTSAWAATRGIPHTFDSYDALLESGAVDAVYIPLPNSMHAEWTVRALSAGLPVLCEKPAATTAYDASRIRDAAIQSGLPVVEAFMYFFHPLYRQVEQMITNGRIGSVKSIESRFSWKCDDPSSGPALSELHGGALFDVGCYCVHLSRKIAGREPVSVMAAARNGFTDPGCQGLGFGPLNMVDDMMVGLLDFGQGTAGLFQTAISSFERHAAEITGTDGSIVIDQPWLQDNAPVSINLLDDNGRHPLRIDPADTYQAELEGFAGIVRECVRNRGLSPAALAALADLCGNAATLFALLQSAKTGKAVKPAAL
ncbi:MAG TPA: Gfo/Idh/MocA family oxidoreductase [Myxococcota bacterium]|nr:Gfo/Idh/MocA family oxidoreductase [Myxococcota bacterium]